MKLKTLWTNYKIYGIIIGIVLGTILYNIIPIDFSFLNINSVKYTNMGDAYIFYLIIFLKFYALILLISFFKIKEIMYTILLGIESFKLAGSIAILVRSHSLLCVGSMIEFLFKIIIICFFVKNDRPVLDKIVALFLLFLGSGIEIFFINFL